MGVCLCKDSGDREHESSEDLTHESNRRCNNNEHLSDQVDELVKETLDLIASICEDDPETPSSMVMLHSLTDRPIGWLCLVKSLMRVIPLDHPMGPSVITLLLDDSPLPTTDSVVKVAEMIKADNQTTTSIPCERNFCVILGCLAEKLAGPSSISALTDTTLDYLFKNITSDETRTDVKLFSLIALEKFAQTAENKSTIKRKLATYEENPLVKLEKHVDDENDFTLRQIGFCAKWSLDNYFHIEGRKYSYEVTDVENINVMLSTKDVSEYLKISASGLEARCDSYSFESVRSTLSVKRGAWYFECFIITSGVMQIGWAQKSSHFQSSDGYGVGDDEYSISFDGCRKLTWHKAKSTPIDLPEWHSGSICGCFIDLDTKEIIFSLDGVERAVQAKDTFAAFADENAPLYPAASFMSFQQCRFNFGAEPFRYPPKRNFNIFNEVGKLKPQDKIVLPRHLYLEELRKLSVTDDSCTLCFDALAVIKLIPCNHTGFCQNCVAQIKLCPICRSDINKVEIIEPLPEIASNEATSKDAKAS